MDSSCGDPAGKMSCKNSQRSLLATWRVYSVDEVRRIVVAAPVKSCYLYPIRTFLLRECIDTILPFLTATVNVSLRHGCLLTSHKMAVVTPLLKKSSVILLVLDHLISQLIN